MIRHVFDTIGGPVLTGIFCVLFVAEAVVRLRRRTQPRLKRGVINFLLSFPAFTLLRILLLPAMVEIAARNQEWRLGLVYLVCGVPDWISAPVVFLLLDYTNYLWHVLNHRVPLLWRFHLVHHTDLDLDVTTAVRFHFGEIIGSVFFRGMAVLIVGASPLTVLVYEIVFEAATQFHHSNLKLPVALERSLNLLFVTPRMHGIHHSVYRNETDSNYSVIFSWWDRLHRTIHLKVPQQAVTIGVPSYHDPHELTIGYLIQLPFTRIRQWEKDFEHRAGPNEEDDPGVQE